MKTKTAIALLIIASCLSIIACDEADISPSERSKSGKTSSHKSSKDKPQEKVRVPS